MGDQEETRFQKNLRWLARPDGPFGSPRALSLVAGANDHWVSQLLTSKGGRRKSGSPHAEKMAKLAKKTGYTEDQLKNEDISKINSDHNVIRLSSVRRRPVPQIIEELQDIDHRSIRAMRQWFINEGHAVQELSDLEGEAQILREELRRQVDKPEIPKDSTAIE